MIAMMMAALLASESPADIPAEWAGCTVIEIHADGSLTTTSPQTSSRNGLGASVAASASSQGQGARSSSVAVSSSSGGGSRTSASASASTDGRSRVVSQRRDGDGCVVTVDERSNKKD